MPVTVYHFLEPTVKRDNSSNEVQVVHLWAQQDEFSLVPGGLARWQAKRVATYVEEHLGTGIRASDLAAIARLSISHFFRAFRKSFGDTPHSYIRVRRMRRAQAMMLTSDEPLVQIALDCGMCDQAHFSRVFRKVVGTNPWAWRRQFSPGPATPLEPVGETPTKQLSQVPS